MISFQICNVDTLDNIRRKIRISIRIANFISLPIDINPYFRINFLVNGSTFICPVNNIR